MKKILTIAVILFGSQVIAQTIVKSSIDSGGESVSNGSIQVLYTIGQVAVQEASAGDIILSEGFISSTSITLSNNDDKLLNKFLLYPNPTKRKLYLSGDVTKLKSINIYSITGQLVMEVKDSFSVINTESLQSAIYFVKLNTTNGSRMFKIIKE